MNISKHHIASIIAPMNSQSVALSVNSTPGSGDDIDEPNKRVLSIQSHVASGYVGNKAAVFPLQLLEFEVDVINSVQFSNHTGYPCGWEGEVLDGTMLERLVAGMERNGLLSSDDPDSDDGIGNILTGYIGSESFLGAVVSVVRKLKSLNVRCRYICDPVLGDMGKFYVPKELVDIYRRDILPLADVITPNQFEIEQLTGIKILTIGDAHRACCTLHDAGVSLVLITSIVFPAALSDGRNASADDSADDLLKPPSNDSIGMFASQRKPNPQPQPTQEEHQNHTDEQYILYTPRISGHFTGTGDVCAALFLGWTAADDHDKDIGGLSLACALEKVAGTMHAIVQRTATASAKKQALSSSTAKTKIVSSRELQLIQSRDLILHPPSKFRSLRVR